MNINSTMRNLEQIFKETTYNNKPITDYNEFELRCILVKLSEELAEIKNTSEGNDPILPKES